jgi:hypothetical protein
MASSEELRAMTEALADTVKDTIGYRLYDDSEDVDLPQCQKWYLSESDTPGTETVILEFEGRIAARIAVEVYETADEREALDG